MQRGRKKASADDRTAALRIQEVQRVISSNLSLGADAAKEIGKIRTASHGQVLAIVHFTSVGKSVGSGAAAQMRALFEQADAEARFSQRDGGGQARQPAADHEN